MNNSTIIMAQLRCVGLILGGLVLLSLAAGRFYAPPPGLHRRIMPSPGMAWSDAGHYAKEAGDTDLLIAFVHSNIPEARKTGTEFLVDAEPSRKVFEIWSLELADPDPELQHRGFLSIYKAIEKFGIKPSNLPIMPGWELFQKNPDYYTTTWRAWWNQYREALIPAIAGPLAPSSAQPRFSTPEN